MPVRTCPYCGAKVKAEPLGATNVQIHFMARLHPDGLPVTSSEEL